MTSASARAAGALDAAAARNAVAAVAAACSGHVGLAVRHLGTGEELTWNPDVTIQTASTVKVAVHAEVMRQARLGLVDLAAPVTTRARDLAGGSGVLGILRPGMACTVADLCTLMIAVSDNTATNMLIDLLGGVDAVNRGVTSLGYPGIRLHHKVTMPPLQPPAAAAPAAAPPAAAAAPPAAAPAAAPPAPAAAPPAAAPAAASPAAAPAAARPAGPLATATPAGLCRLLSGLYTGSVVDRAASAQMITTLRCQQDRSLFPRAYLTVAEPDEPPGPGTPALAHKTGCVGGCRADTGLLYLPGDGGTVAFCAVADRLADHTMTALSEGEEILGRLGAIVLARWWPRPGPVPVRRGWLPAPAPGER